MHQWLKILPAIVLMHEECLIQAQFVSKCTAGAEAHSSNMMVCGLNTDGNSRILTRNCWALSKVAKLLVMPGMPDLHANS